MNNLNNRRYAEELIVKNNTAQYISSMLDIM
jgi:hypothetical protein